MIRESLIILNRMGEEWILNHSVKIRLAETVLSRREESDSYLIYDTHSKLCLVTNEIGAEIIEYCRTQKSINDIINHFSHRKRKEPHPSANDIRKFVNDLKDVGIVKENGTRATIDLEKVGECNFSLKKPIRMSWLLTYRCNLKCKHCFAECDTSGNLSRELSKKQISSVIKMLSSTGLFGVDLSGGEIFVRSDILEILNEISDTGMRLCISTNGTLINRDIAEALSKLDSLGGLQISLDGATAKTNDFLRGKGAFVKAVEGIQFVADSGIDDLNVHVSYSTHNIDELEDIVALVHDLGVKMISLAPIRPWGRGKQLEKYITSPRMRYQIAERMGELQRKYGNAVQIRTDTSTCDIDEDNSDPLMCFIPISMAILPDGDVVPCMLLTHSRKTFSPIMGNVLEDSIVDIWNSKKAKKFRQATMLTNREHCSICTFSKRCGSYCLADIFEKGSLKPTNEFYENCWKNVTSEPRLIFESRYREYVQCRFGHSWRRTSTSYTNVNNILEKSICAASLLSADYDCGVSLASNGLWLGFVFSIFDLPIFIVDAERSARGIKWNPVDSINSEIIKEKRVIIFDNDTITSNTLRKAIKEIGKYRPKRIDVALIFNHSNPKEEKWRRYNQTASSIEKEVNRIIYIEDFPPYENVDSFLNELFLIK